MTVYLISCFIIADLIRSVTVYPYKLNCLCHVVRSVGVLDLPKQPPARANGGVAGCFARVCRATCRASKLGQLCSSRTERTAQDLLWCSSSQKGSDVQEAVQLPGVWAGLGLGRALQSMASGSCRTRISANFKDRSVAMMCDTDTRTHTNEGRAPGSEEMLLKTSKNTT